MNDKPSYPYATGDLLESRNNYSYSSYQGLPFLVAWRAQRADAMAEKDDTVPRAGSQDCLAPTDALLEALWWEIHDAGVTATAIRRLAALVQRFEVSKRLHDAYTPGWRPVAGDRYHNLGRYIRFAELLELAYRATASLVWLNALLKCLDTLTALRQRLDAGQHKRLQFLIRQEEAHVRCLAGSLTGADNGA